MVLSDLVAVTLLLVLQLQVLLVVVLLLQVLLVAVLLLVVLVVESRLQQKRPASKYL